MLLYLQEYEKVQAELEKLKKKFVSWIIKPLNQLLDNF